MQFLEGRRRVAGLLGEREDRLGVDRHLRFVVLEAVAGEELLVVLDDPVVDADDGAVADGVVVGEEGGVALRVVADVEERVHRVHGDVHDLEERARAGALLVHDDGLAGPAVGVPGRVGAALGNRGEECPAGQRPVDPARCAQAVSSNAAHAISL